MMQIYIPSHTTRKHCMHALTLMRTKVEYLSHTEQNRSTTQTDIMYFLSWL